MDVADLIRAHGGCMSWTQITSCVHEARLRNAVLAGQVVRLPSGGYAVPEVTRSAAAALALRGVLSHRSAAARWGLALPPGPEVEHLTIPRRAYRKALPYGVALHYRDLSPADVCDGATSPMQTVVDCLRDLCLRDALSVGDSALRSGLADNAELLERARVMRGPGAARVRQRVRWLDPRAENAFESSCRAILIDGLVTGFLPQVTIRHNGRFLGRVDLGNVALRILVECESFAHHGQREALRRDCRRYSDMEAAGWRVLRVTWEHVMFDPDWVLRCVREAVLNRPTLR